MELPISDMIFCGAVAGACLAYMATHWDDFFPK